MDIWDKLYEEASLIRGERKVSHYVYAGAVSAALLTKDGHIYKGVCVDATCSIGLCAEINAIFNMLTNGENEFTKLVVISSKGTLGMPCGVCRELIVELMPKKYKDIEILINLETKETIKFEELCPRWWI